MPLVSVTVIQVKAPTGAQIKALRKKLGLSQRQFAEQYCLSDKLIKNWEQGTRKPEAPASLLPSLIEIEPDTIKRLIKKLSTRC